MDDISHFLLWGYKDSEQQKRIAQLEKRSYDTLSDFEKIRNLEWRVENLILLNQATWLLLKEKFNLSEEELIKKFEEADLADGKADGRMSPAFSKEIWKCENCQKENSPRFVRCVRCDNPIPRQGATEAFKKIT